MSSRCFESLSRSGCPGRNPHRCSRCPYPSQKQAKHPSSVGEKAQTKRYSGCKPLSLDRTLDSSVPLNERLYGYHRLPDPLVAVPHDGKWVVGTVSDVEGALQKDNLTIIQHEKPPEPYKG